MSYHKSSLAMAPYPSSPSDPCFPVPLHDLPSITIRSCNLRSNSEKRSEIMGGKAETDKGGRIFE